MESFDCIVVGAGIHGLCTAFWLRHLGVGRIGILEQFGPGHDRGSSHGATRITRSSYAAPEFVALATRAHRTEWPALEQALGRTLRIPTPGVFFGPAHGPIRDTIATTTAGCSAAEALPVATARSRFPLLRFDADDAVLLDHTAAVVLAADTMAGLRQWLAAHSVELHWHTRVQRVVEHHDRVELETRSGSVAARQVVFADGAWANRTPSSPAPAGVLRQQVGYVSLAAPAPALRAGAFPVWARIGIATNEFHYGLPATDERGVKTAVHVTQGPGCDPEAEPPPVDREALLALARQRFTVTVHDLRDYEPCLYTMAAGDRLQVLRQSPRIVRVAACSGHAFKFGPVIGRMAAELVNAVAR